MGTGCLQLLMNEQLLDIVDKIEEYADLHNLDIDLKTPRGHIIIKYEWNLYKADDFEFTRGENQN